MNKQLFKKIAGLFFLTSTIFQLSCSSQGSKNSNSIEAHDNNAILNGNQIVSIDGFDVTKYKLAIDYLEFDYQELTLDHILCVAAEECDYEMCHKLLENGANPNMICDVDHVITELSFCDETSIELTNLFIKYGVDINGSDEENTSFLAYAVGQNNIDLVKLILKNGGDPMQIVATTNLGCLALHDCTSVEMFELLKPYYPDLNVQCRNGRTLLHFCGKENLIDLAQYLLNSNLIDKSLKDSKGETAYDYAVKRDYKTISYILKD